MFYIILNCFEELVDTQNWHKLRFDGQFGRTGMTGYIKRSDRLGQICQMINWTSPLRRSRQGDRNAYMEHSIWRPVRPVRKFQSELGVVF